AQTLRILTRLEPKVLGPGGRCFGLNLTRACLDAATKYPWPRTAGLAKYGVYAEDLEVFAWLRRDAPGNRRCLEAQVMDWSDDVAYSVHDVEDGILAGRIVLAQLGDAAERAELAGIAAKHFSHCSVGELEAAALRLLELEAVSEVAGSGGRRGYDGSFVALAALKQLTSDLVGRFATAAIAATRAAFPVSATDRYGADLLIPTGAAEEVAVLKAVALRYVMSDPGRLRVQREQRDRLAELTRALVCAAPHGLDPGFRAAFAEAPDDDASLRVVIDQVASLTDAQALGWHRRICLG
ncbi:MAG: deoxyguanosinetriphosphate triphosphohydrolase, partial [Sciscionella sp.]